MRTFRFFVLLAMSGSLSAGPALSQENVGSISQPQTVAPSITIPQAQPANCGRAPSAAELNTVVQKVRPMFPNPAGFNANLEKINQDACPRSRAAAYLIHLLSINNWKIVR